MTNWETLQRLSEKATPGLDVPGSHHLIPSEPLGIEAKLSIDDFEFIGALWHAYRTGCLSEAQSKKTEEKTPLIADFEKAFPDGTCDHSSYSDIEDALDRIEAPMRDGNRWLTLPERIASIPIRQRQLGVTDEVAIQEIVVEMLRSFRRCEGGVAESMRAALNTVLVLLGSGQNEGEKR